MVRLYYYNLALTNIFKMREIIINIEGTELFQKDMIELLKLSALN